MNKVVLRFALTTLFISASFYSLKAQSFDAAQCPDLKQEYQQNTKHLYMLMRKGAKNAGYKNPDVLELSSGPDYLSKADKDIYDQVEDRKTNIDVVCGDYIKGWLLSMPK